jgi:hypothetical protein
MNAITTSSQYMEHRWGTRVPLEARAELWTAEGVSGFGMVRNASLSGAWVETRLKFRPLARVAVQPMDRPGEWLDACVVRVDADGVGIEWLDPGLHAVSALLSLRSDSVMVMSESVPHDGPRANNVVQMPSRTDRPLA